MYLGYPNYWGTMPMAVFTFWEHYVRPQSLPRVLPFMVAVLTVIQMKSKTGVLGQNKTIKVYEWRK
ncbi:MAG: hypothetical protein ACLUX8_08795 [Clostridium sp.]